jgi:hypothetical protein
LTGCPRFPTVPSSVAHGRIIFISYGGVLR